MQQHVMGRSMRAHKAFELAWMLDQVLLNGKFLHKCQAAAHPLIHCQLQRAHHKVGIVQKYVYMPMRHTSQHQSNRQAGEMSTDLSASK